MRIQDIDQLFYRHLQAEALQLVRVWLVKTCQPKLDDFKSKHADNYKDKLLGYLGSLRLHMLGATDAPSGIAERARCLIACIYDDTMQELVANVMKLICADKQLASGYTEQYRRLRKIVSNPASVLESSDVDDFDVLVFACASAIRQRELDIADNILHSLAELEAYAEDYDQAQVEFLRHRLASHSQSSSIQMAQARPCVRNRFSAVEELEVLAVCTNIVDGARAFSKVLAAREKDGEWHELDQHEAERLFPRSGSIVHFSGPNYPTLPKLQSYAVWRVVIPALTPEQMQQHKTQVQAAEKLAPIHRIVPLEHIASSEKAKVREWLKHYNERAAHEQDANGKELARSEPVLLLADGLLVYSTNSYRRLVDENFTQPLHSWKQGIAGLRLKRSNVLLQMGELPHEHDGYDLIPAIDGLARSLNSGNSDYTNKEKAKFIELMHSISENHALDQRLKDLSIPEKLDQEYIEALADELVRTENVRQRFAKERSAEIGSVSSELEEASSQLAQTEQLNADLDAAKREKTKLSKQIEEKLEEEFVARRTQLRKDGKQQYELMMLSKAMISQLEQRLDSLEQRLEGRNV